MPQFILFIRGGDPAESPTPEQIQQSIARYRAWAGALAEQNKLVSAFKLSDGGRIMSGAMALNARPRKYLGFMTPEEAMLRQINQLNSLVALQT